jgi:hypothetical protein
MTDETFDMAATALMWLACVAGGFVTGLCLGLLAR